MTQQTSFLINIFSFLLLSSSLLAGPMFEERPGQVNCKQQVEEQANNQRERTAGDEAPYSSEDKERNGSSIASIAEVPLNTSGKPPESESTKAPSSELIEPSRQVIISSSLAGSVLGGRADQVIRKQQAAEQVAEQVANQRKRTSEDRAFCFSWEQVTNKRKRTTRDKIPCSSWYQANDGSEIASIAEVPLNISALNISEESTEIESIKATSSEIIVPNHQVIVSTNPKEKIEEELRFATDQLELIKGKANEANQNGRTDFFQKCQALATKHEKAVALMQDLQKEAEGKTQQGIILIHAIIATRLSVDADLEAIKAEEIGNLKLVGPYREIAAKQEKAATLHMQAFQAEAEGKTTQALFLYVAGVITRLSAETDLKAIEADKSEKTQLAQCYRVAAAKQEVAAIFYMQFLQQNDAGETEQAIFSRNAGVITRMIAEADLKAIEAEKSEKLKLAECHREIAAKQEMLLELNKQAFEAMLAGATNQVIILSYAAKSIKLSVVADLKAIEKEEIRKLELAERYRKIAAKGKDAAKWYMQALQQYNAGATNQVIILSYAAKNIRLSAEVDLQAIKAEEIGKLKLAERCREIAKDYEGLLAPFM